MGSMLPFCVMWVVTHLVLAFVLSQPSTNTAALFKRGKKGYHRRLNWHTRARTWPLSRVQPDDAPKGQPNHEKPGE